MIAPGSATEAYRRAAVRTASKEQLVIMAYEVAVKSLDGAIRAIGERDFEEANRLLQKAQDIVMELMLSLDMEAGGEIAQNLWRLYDYMYFRLVQANVRKDAEMAREVRDMMASLLEAWREAWEKLKRESSKESPSQEELREPSAAPPRASNPYGGVSQIPPKGGINLAG